MKSLVSLLYTYAIRHEITDKDYTVFIEVRKAGGDLTSKGDIHKSLPELLENVNLV